MIAVLNTNTKVITLQTRSTLEELTLFIEEFNLQGWKIEGQIEQQYFNLPFRGIPDPVNPWIPPYTVTCSNPYKDTQPTIIPR